MKKKRYSKLDNIYCDCRHLYCGTLCNVCVEHVQDGMYGMRVLRR